MEKSKDDAPANLLVYSSIIYCPARVRLVFAQEVDLQQVLQYSLIKVQLKESLIILIIRMSD